MENVIDNYVHQQLKSIELIVCGLHFQQVKFNKNISVILFYLSDKEPCMKRNKYVSKAVAVIFLSVFL
jgi:hypothetical protein